MFSCLVLILGLGLTPTWARQPKQPNASGVVIRNPTQESDNYKFAPPPPPPLEGSDYDELEDDGFEAGDDGFRPPPPPPIPGGPPMGAPPPPPPPDFRNTGSYISQPGKFRFKVLDGEFYEKGKKRGRGRQQMGRSAN